MSGDVHNLVQHLDALGVPAIASTKASASALAEAGLEYDKLLVGSAVNIRKSKAKHDALMAGAPEPERKPCLRCGVKIPAEHPHECCKNCRKEMKAERAEQERARCADRYLAELVETAALAESLHPVVEVELVLNSSAAHQAARVKRAGPAFAAPTRRRKAEPVTTSYLPGFGPEGGGA